MIEFPNCKINLGLNIVRKREDGFHDLETIFYPIDNQQDRLEIVRAGQGCTMTLSGNALAGSVEDNLCVRAYRLMAEKCDISGVSIHLEKHIAAQAGLGGGSADAAFTLKMLNELFTLGLTNSELKTMALALGSDVPFFIDNVPAFATGRGEILEPIALDLSHKVISVVTPPVCVSTKMAFQTVVPRPPKVDLREAIQAPIGEWKSLIVNDFEETIFARFPQLRRIKEALYYRGADYVSMSGSGSAIFAIGDKAL